MKPSSIIHALATDADSKGNGIVRISPGPIEVKVTRADYDGARVLDWLIDNVPGDTKTQYVMDVLDAAKWWATLLLSLPSDSDVSE